MPLVLSGYFALSSIVGGPYRQAALAQIGFSLFSGPLAAKESAGCPRLFAITSLMRWSERVNEPLPAALAGPVLGSPAIRHEAPAAAAGEGRRIGPFSTASVPALTPVKRRRRARPCQRWVKYPMGLLDYVGIRDSFCNAIAEPWFPRDSRYDPLSAYIRRRHTPKSTRGN